MTGPILCPPGHISVPNLSARLGIHQGSIYQAFNDARLDGGYVGGRMFIRDIGDDRFLKAMPRAVRESECLDRWLNVHDIRTMGQRAVEETA